MFLSLIVRTPCVNSSSRLLLSHRVCVNKAHHFYQIVNNRFYKSWKCLNTVVKHKFYFNLTHSEKRFCIAGIATMASKSGKSTAPLLVVDTDPGTDDALALYMLLAAHDRGLINVLAITCVCGNTSVDNGTRNALRVLNSIDKLSVPVYRGAPEPIIVEPKGKDEVQSTQMPYHGHDGFGDSKFSSEPDLNLIRKEPAVLKLIELAQTHKGKLNIVCLGPLTNIALAIKSDSKFASNVEQIYVMGGNFTATGNMTSCAEFNFHNDPEAAHIVLASAQSHITLAPWETCMHLGIPYEWRLEVLGKAGTKAAELLNSIEGSVFKRTRNKQWYPCDALITAAFILPSMVTKVKVCHLTVELHGARTRGQVVVDHLDQCEDNVKLIQDADLETFKQLLLMAVGHPDCSITF